MTSTNVDAGIRNLFVRITAGSVLVGLAIALGLFALGHIQAALNVLGGVLLSLGLLFGTIQTGRAILVRKRKRWVWTSIWLGKIVLAALVLWVADRYKVLEVPWLILGYSLHLFWLTIFGADFWLHKPAAPDRDA